MAKNPFTPTFGVSPPVLVGRGEILDEFEESLNEGPGAPARASLYTGPRGSGKTVMLNEVGAIAEAHGWYVIHETADEGLLDRLADEHLPAILGQVDPAGPERTKVKGLKGGGFGASWETEKKYEQAFGLRNQLSMVLNFLESNETGLLITLDELNQRNIDELRRFAVTMQHLFREGREIAFAGAGLLSAVSAVLSADVLTFLERAERHVLDTVPIDDVSNALIDTFKLGGRGLPLNLAERAAKFTSGYPFLIQLVGYHIWRQSPKNTMVAESDIEPGLIQAERRIGSLVFAPTLKGLSEVDRTFLIAMARDDGPSSMGDIAKRMKVDRKYAGVYRARLLEGGLIEPGDTYGHVRFVNERLRDYLRDHVAYRATNGVEGGNAG